MKDAYISMQSEFPEQFSFDFYNGKTGLFPWGITDNGDELFWNYKRDSMSYFSRWFHFREKLLWNNIILIMWE